MKRELVQPIRGIIPPLVTPLTEQGKLDNESLARLVEHLLAGGVHGLFILGTTGEGPSLSKDLQIDVIQQTAKLVDGRLPVLVGVTHPALEESLELAKVAADTGCDAVVAAPPYYFDIGQPELESYFRQLASNSPLPLVLYNMPAMTGIAVSAEVSRHLAEDECIVAIKDSSGDLAYFAELLAITKKLRGFPVLMGPEGLLAESLRMGGSGGVAGGANLWPTLFTTLFDAYVEGNAADLAQLEETVRSFGEIYTVGPHSVSAIVARTKAALSLLGICGDKTADPIERSNSLERAAIHSILQKVGMDSPLCAMNLTLSSP